MWPPSPHFHQHTQPRGCHLCPGPLHKATCDRAKKVQAGRRQLLCRVVLFLAVPAVALRGGGERAAQTMLRSSSGSARSSLVSGGGVQKRAPGRAAAAGSRVSRILIPEPHKARARSCNGPCTSEDSELNCDLLMCCAGNGAAKKGQKSSSKDTCNHPWYGSDHLGVDDISNMLVQLLPAMPMSASLQTCKFA